MALNPKLKETAEKVATDYPKAGPERRRLLTMLRSPRYGILVASPDSWDAIEMDRADFNDIDSYDANDKNWWCPFEPDRQLGGLRTQFDAAVGLAWFDDYWGRRLGAVVDSAEQDGVKAAREAVLRQHPMIKAVDWQELADLATADSGPRKLSAAAIAWGKASPATTARRKPWRWQCARRYGAAGMAGMAATAEAQQLLQRRFDGVWAARRLTGSTVCGGTGKSRRHEAASRGQELAEAATAEVMRQVRTGLQVIAEAGLCNIRSRINIP
jgi:hypothetical protein